MNPLRYQIRDKIRVNTEVEMRHQVSEYNWQRTKNETMDQIHLPLYRVIDQIENQIKLQKHPKSKD